MSHIKKVIPDENDRNYILSQYGRALTGLSYTDQTSLVQIGKGAAGKSFLLLLCKESIGPYFIELPSDTFEVNYKDRNKTLTDLALFPVRIAWINEMTSTRIDDSLYKKFIDGELQTTQLYKDGNLQIKLRCKTIFTSNNIMNIIIDSGIDRRLDVYNHVSKFTEKKEEVDEKKNIYLSKKDLLQNIIDEKLLDAWNDILCEYGRRWLNKDIPEKTENIRDAKLLITSTNDIFGDFIERHITVTNNENDRIGKNEMRQKFLEMYPNKKLTVQQVISSLKDKGIEYNPKYRCEGLQGCYVNVKFKDVNDVEEEEEEEGKHSAIKLCDYVDSVKIKKLSEKLGQVITENEELKRINEEQQKEIELLKSLLNSIEKQNEKKKEDKKESPQEKPKEIKTKKTKISIFESGTINIIETEEEPKEEKPKEIKTRIKKTKISKEEETQEEKPKRKVTKCDIEIRNETKKKILDSLFD